MKVLAIGPHPDDVELGCFGSLCRLADEGNEINILILSQGEGGVEEGNREKEAKESASLLKCNLYIENLRDRYISEGQETIKVIEKYIDKLKPDIVFIPSKNDTHQDHRATYYAARVACRLINNAYIYQSPSSTVGFMPTLYIDITKYIGQKIKAVKIHSSQGNKAYMSDRAVEGLAAYRAFEIFRNDKYFEAFEVYRSIK